MKTLGSKGDRPQVKFREGSSILPPPNPRSKAGGEAHPEGMGAPIPMFCCTAARRRTRALGLGGLAGAGVEVVKGMGLRARAASP